MRQNIRFMLSIRLKVLRVCSYADHIFLKFTLALNPKVSQKLCHRFVSLGNTNVVVKSCCTCAGGSRSLVPWARGR
jgi:hypothetical protein